MLQQEFVFFKAADVKYKQTNQVTPLVGIVDKNAKTNPEIKRPTGFATACLKGCGRQLHSRQTSLPSRKYVEIPDGKG